MTQTRFASSGRLIGWGWLVMLAMAAAPQALAMGDEPAPVTVGGETVSVAVPPQLAPLYEAPVMPPLKQAAAGSARKDMFISYLAPIVAEVNDEMRQRHAALLRVQGWLEAGKALDAQTRDWLDRLAQRYRVKAKEPAEQVAGLVRRVDIIPVSLALAQGALESAWGTSRFALLGNNIFGKWCFKPGCGIVPARRAPGAVHEVAAYPNVAAAVRDYMHHLNSHPIYEELRRRRAAARAADRVPQGSDLAAGLDRYSAKGQQYVEIIRSVIRVNELARFDG